MLNYEIPKLPRSLGLSYFYFEIGIYLFFGACNLEFYFISTNESNKKMRYYIFTKEDNPRNKILNLFQKY